MTSEAGPPAAGPDAAAESRAPDPQRTAADGPDDIVSPTGATTGAPDAAVERSGAGITDQEPASETAPASQIPLGAGIPAATPAEGPHVPGYAPADGADVPGPAPTDEPAVPTPAPADEPAVPIPTPADEPAVPTPTPAEGPDVPTPAPADGPDVPTPAPADGPDVPGPAPADQPDVPGPATVSAPDHPDDGGTALVPPPELARVDAPARPSGVTPGPMPFGTRTPDLAPATAPTLRLPEPSVDEHPWGRVDEHGVVWVKVAGSQRPVGSYPGATPAEALSYFERKFTGLVVEVDLLERRLRTTDVAVRDAAQSIDKLRTQVLAANAVGDLQGLVLRLDALEELLAERRAEVNAERARQRDAARATKERIVTEAESLAESTEWKRAGDRLRELLDEWKAAPRLDRKVDDELWKRFSSARTTFDKHRRTYFAGLDAQRGEAAARKEKLVGEAESLADSTDWVPTAARFRDLMVEWKASGRASRTAEEALWERFKSAQDTFFAARNADLAQRDAGQRDNLERKQALVAEAEAILPVTELAAARDKLRSVHERWGAIGHVPREAKGRLEGRLRAVEEAVARAEQAEWARTNPEARARAQAAVDSLRATIADLEAKAERARAAGDERRVREHETAAAARREWLAEAERALADFSR